MNCCPNQLNSLVWRHLRDSGYHRSAYLFYTECGLAEAGLADKIESLPRGSLLNVVQKGVLYTEAVQPKEIRDVRTDQVTVFEAAGLVVEPERRETSRQDNLEDIIDVVGTSGPSSDVPRETNAAVESNGSAQKKKKKATKKNERKSQLETDNEKAPLSGSPLFVSQHNETVSSETVPSGPTLGNQEMVSHSSDFSTSLTALKPELPTPTFQPCELGGPKELTPNTLVKEEGTNNFLNSTLANLTKNIVPASYGEHLPQSFRAILRDAPSSSSSISLSPELLAILTSTDPSFLNAQFTLLPPVLASSTTFSVPSLTFCPPVVSSVAPTLPPQRILRFNPPPIMPALPTMVSPKVPVKTETSSNEKSVTEAPPIEKMMTRSRTRPLVSDPPTLPPVVAPKKERRHKLASLREHFCSLARAKQITRHPQVTTGLHFEPCSYQLFHRHRGEIFNSAWNPLIDYLVTGSADSDARIWDLTEVNSRKYEGSNVDTITRRLPHHTEAPDTPEAISRKAVTSLDWNRTGSVLATGCFDGAVRLWTQTGHLRNTLEAQKGPISALRWNYNGDYLISSSVDKSVVAWDLRNTTASKAAIAQQFSVHNTSVVDISWVSYDSFISCSTDKTIKLCEIGMEGSRKTFLGHTDDINAVSYNHNCNRFASCSDDRTVKIWSVNESFPVADLTDHTLEIYSMRWNPQGTNIASASFDTTVKLWDVQRQNCLHTWENIGKPSQCVAFSPDGKYMCIGGSCRSLFIYDLRSYTLVKTFITENALTGFSEVCWNVSGEKLTGICSDGSIMLFDTRFLGLIR